MAGPRGARDALDAGAGTGKFTELLLGMGLAVTAVDPSADMLGQLRAHYPAATAVQATAEARACPRRPSTSSALPRPGTGVTPWPQAPNWHASCVRTERWA
jgi:SAM-dependent methyltransferase